MQTTMLAFRANARYGVPNTEDERLSHAVYLMDSKVTLSQAAAVCMVSERALRTRWSKRQADRRADEVGLLRNEWDSLLPVVRGRLLRLATGEGFRVTDRPSASAGDSDRLQVRPGSGGQSALLDAPLDAPGHAQEVTASRSGWWSRSLSTGRPARQPRRRSARWWCLPRVTAERWPWPEIDQVRSCGNAAPPNRRHSQRRLHPAARRPPTGHRPSVRST